MDGTERGYSMNIYFQIALFQLQIPLHGPEGPGISTSHLTNAPQSSTGWCLDTEWLCNLVKCLFFTPTLSCVVHVGAFFSKLPSCRKQSELFFLFLSCVSQTLFLSCTAFYAHKIMHGSTWKLSTRLHRDKVVAQNQAEPRCSREKMHMWNNSCDRLKAKAS